MILAACELQSAQANRISLALPNEYRPLLAEGTPTHTALLDLLQQQVGYRPELSLQTLYREGQGGRQEDARERRYRDAQSHPLVQDLLRRFDADIVAREPSAREIFLRQIDESANEP